MKVNIEVYKKDSDQLYTTIYGVDELHLDPDYKDMIIHSWGLVNYLKHPFDYFLVFKIVNDDNSEIDK